MFALLLAGCNDTQSTLAPAGTGAQEIARLSWVMFAGAAVVWLAVMALALHATRRRAAPHPPRSARRLVLVGGVLVPTVVLGTLLYHGLLMMPGLREPPQQRRVVVEVSGEQWWWRVRYLREGRPPVTAANEVRLPRGERTELRLSSPDVIHSFWVPALAGKLDMTPGRTSTLVLEPTREGVFEGICAEYCGTAHALMRFKAVVMEPDAFDGWLDRQAAPARPPDGALARHGQAAFRDHGCGACHAVRGTGAAGGVGPDLTHIGSRLSLGAGILPNDREALRGWIADAHASKPGVLMPAFHMLAADEVEAIAAYLEGLE
ncbi:cytochrome c oxidase subunit II [Lysobacter sp. GX 14042]|uniref:cytochrome c oxidase subunit II n=1 Tax=Lysobacter sp. GX 14042 TaxID=2907155 RepID=UPI001F330146|nr:cytochrome c oxidase subunit II [Lysobacter sp. GX 14042]